METYEKLSDEKLKVTKTATVDGFPLKNETIEGVESIRKELTESIQTLKDHDARRQVIVDRVEMLTRKLQTLGVLLDPVDVPAEPIT